VYHQSTISRDDIQIEAQKSYAKVFQSEYCRMNLTLGLGGGSASPQTVNGAITLWVLNVPMGDFHFDEVPEIAGYKHIS
jgi:hypothetical protein